MSGVFHDGVFCGSPCGVTSEAAGAEDEPHSGMSRLAQCRGHRCTAEGAHRGYSAVRPRKPRPPAVAAGSSGVSPPPRVFDNVTAYVLLAPDNRFPVLYVMWASNNRALPENWRKHYEI